jgi:hypothetical protein
MERSVPSFLDAYVHAASLRKSTINDLGLYIPQQCLVREASVGISHQRTLSHTKRRTKIHPTPTIMRLDKKKMAK